MLAVDQIPDAPPVELRYRPSAGLIRPLREAWGARELIRTLAERDIRARYKQAVLGFTWAFVQPLSLVLVFTLLSRRVGLAGGVAANVPYPLFAYVGLLGWGFFAGAVSAGGLSLVNNTALLNKVYCPRQAFPIAGTAVAAVDTIVSLAAFVVMCVVYRFVPHLTSLWVPVIALVQVMFTVAVALVVAAVVVYVRDVRNVLPLLLQIGLFATPVAYSLTAVPSEWRLWYSLVDPLAPVIDGYRRAILYGQAPDWGLLGPAAVVSAVLLMLAITLFSRLESGMADVL
ncbi:MAG: type transport system permease protein [Frankiaceae bacterium]|nr:type transport system permease protein [Frankiaceae bacterium]